MTSGSHAFHAIYLHLNWHVDENRPVFVGEAEKFVWDFIREYCSKLKGVHFIEIGGTQDHLHLAVQIEPHVSASEVASKLKGSSAHAANEHFGSGFLQWQRGYGVCSFAKKDLPAVVGYVQRQKEHHRKGTVNRTLEISEADYKDYQAKMAAEAT